MNPISHNNTSKAKSSIGWKAGLGFGLFVILQVFHMNVEIRIPLVGSTVLFWIFVVVIPYIVFSLLSWKTFATHFLDAISDKKSLKTKLMLGSLIVLMQILIQLIVIHPLMDSFWRITQQWVATNESIEILTAKVTKYSSNRSGTFVYYSSDKGEGKIRITQLDSAMQRDNPELYWIEFHLQSGFAGMWVITDWRFIQ
jgi:hypothetical protein